MEPHIDGSSKRVSDVKGHEEYVHVQYTLHDDPNREEIERGYFFRRMQGELELYDELGDLELSPKIVHVQTADKLYSLKDFLRLEDITFNPATMVLIVEKKACSYTIIDHFENAGEFFEELKSFLTRLVTEGYYNTDIKLENLCHDEMGFLMIDLDPDYVKKILPNVHPSVYVNYMLFQTYLCMKVSGVPYSLNFQQLNLSQEEYSMVIAFLLSFEGAREQLMINIKGPGRYDSYDIVAELHKKDNSLPRHIVKIRKPGLSRMVIGSALAGVSAFALYKMMGHTKRKRRKQKKSKRLKYTKNKRYLPT
jgi:hypothetical protein